MVISHDPEGGGVNVMFKSGQIAGHPVKMGYDQADGLRIRQRALPGKGHGALSFSRMAISETAYGYVP
jgi:hypothetical protein